MRTEPIAPSSIRRIAVAMLGHDGELGASPVAGLDHRDALSRVSGHRLLDQDMLAVLGRSQHLPYVGVGRGGDHDDVDVVAGNQRGNRVLDIHTEVGPETRCTPPTCDGTEFGSFAQRGDLGPRSAHEAGADDSNTEWIHSTNPSLGERPVGDRRGEAAASSAAT